MLGSDYPFPLGEQDIGALVRGCGHLSDVERRMILGGNAASFFGVPPMQQHAAPRREVVVPPPLLRAQQAAGYWLVGASSGARFASPPPAFALQYRLPGAQQLSARPLSSVHGPRPSAARGRRGLSTQPAAISPAEFEDDLHHSHHTSPAPPQRHVSSHVDGMLCDAADGASLPLIDQASGKLCGTVPSSSAADVADAVAAASRALQRGEWAAASTAERARVLWRAAALLEEESDIFAAAESRDTGKPVRLAAAMDVPRAVANLRFFAGLVEYGSGGELRHGGGADRSSMDDALNYTVRKPVGVVGLVTPWNLPLYLLTWKLAPALAMGNSVVAKPSELAPTTATMLAGLLKRAGLPPGIFNVVHGTGQEAGAALCSHQSVGALSFTGGTQTGATVAAAVAPRFAKLSLELGGKNAMLVFADCDIDVAVDAAVRASFLNAGQICLCASRILVQDSADGFYERFAAAFAVKAAALTLGHPADASTDVGPLVSASHRDKARAHACATLPFVHRSSCLAAP
jgi:acyl-CoA reductase-like NAD-dependent aldehyde dehydrogenase